MNKKSIFKAIVSITVALAFLVPTSAVFANDKTNVRFDPPSQTVGIGETFTASVYVEPKELVIGVNFVTITFDPAYLQANEVTEGTLFGGDAFMFEGGTIDNVAGTISEGFACVKVENNVSTPGSIFVIEFTAKDKIGTSSLVMSGVEVAGIVENLPITVESGSVTVEGDESAMLTIGVIGSGTTVPAPGIHTYILDTVVDLKAIHDLGWSFDHWDGDVTDPLLTITTITMDDDKAVTANFVEDHYILTVSTVGSGHVDVDPDKEFYLYGEEPQLTAVNDSGWAFDSWSGDLSGNTNPTTIFMDGNKDVTATFKEHDTEPPVTICILDPPEPDGDNGWYVSVVTVTLVATDDVSGVESTWYSHNGGYWKIYFNSFTVSSEGEHTIEYYSFDRAGNIEDTKTCKFKIDTKLPSTTHEFDGVIGKEGWFVSNVTVTLSATDATSGVNYTKYNLSDGDWITYVDPFVVTEDGEHMIYYYSVDLAGHTEPTNDEVEFKIVHDIVPPVTTHEFDGIPGDNDWYKSNVVVELFAEDDSAGVDYTMYKLEDDTEWQEYTGPILVMGDGKHTITYYSVDNVGNEEDPPKSATFKIDQTPPTIVLDAGGTGRTWLLKATVSDETSGVAKVEFYVAGKRIGTVTDEPYEWEYTGASRGDIAQAIAFDNAGNLKISNEKEGQSQDKDAFVGWTFLIGWISNVEEAENGITTAQAIRLRYIEFAPTGITVGFVKMKSVEFSSHFLARTRTLRSFDQMSLVFGIFKGGITIEEG